jgi:hypothetical protein
MNFMVNARRALDFVRTRTGLSAPRILLLGLSFAGVLVCARCTVAHYQKWAWGNRGQLAGWLAGMFFLLLAFAPQPRRIVTSLRTCLTPRTAFFAFWVVVFVGSRLWSFTTAPWNGNALFDESGWDLWFLKDYVMGHPFQAAWFHSPISRETLFHYYVWGFFRLWGQNILAYEAALGVIWCATFLFTLLIVDLFFRSYLVTAVAAIIFNFLPFSFLYTFAGYRYPMATALAVASLYFLYLGFRNASSFQLAWGGILAGLCLASSISGKQYLLALALFVVVYGAINWMTLRRPIRWGSVALVLYAWLAAAVPLLGYIVFNRTEYTLYEASFVHSFWQALLGHPSPNNIAYYVQRLGKCFFSVPGDRFFIPDALPVPMPYYLFLVLGLFIALRRGRYEIALLSIIPVVGAFIATAFDNRLLLAIPFWIIAMAFAVDAFVKWQLRWTFKAIIWAVAVVGLVAGLGPSVRYIYKKAENPFTIRHYAQEEVAVSRYLRHIVAGDTPTDPPRIERNEFKRVKNVPEPGYDTLICQDLAYSIIHLFLHDYDDKKILSFCGGSPLYVMPDKEVWRANKIAVLSYVPSKKNLKLVWERTPKTERIINMFAALRGLGREDTISFSFAGKKRQFYVFNVDSRSITQLQDRIRNMPD